MKIEDFFVIVKENAITLKEKLTAEQKDKLDITKLRPFDPSLCLLGQIFGSSDGILAKEVLPKSHRISFESDIIEDFQLLGKLSRLPYERFSYDAPHVIQIRKENFTTPIEVFLMLESNAEDLFQFIKGETETFQPRMLTADEWKEFKDKIIGETLAERN